MKVLFLHGWQSTPGGLKPTYLKDHGHEVLNPALPDDNFDAVVRIAQAEYEQGQFEEILGGRSESESASEPDGPLRGPNRVVSQRLRRL